MMGRPRSIVQNEKIDMMMPSTLLGYLDRLVELEGFGENRSAVIRNFCWKEINRLIEVGTLEHKMVGR